MTSYRCIIIDDDAYAVEGLKEYIGMIPFLTLSYFFTDPVKALMELSEGVKFDLILMDIDMPYMNGIELSRELRVKTDKLVFTTAHTKYGYDAFEVSADAYLLKPYSFGKFAATIARLFPLKHVGEEDHFFVKNKYDSHKLVRVNFKDVIALESKQNYVMIYTEQKNVLTYMSLTEAADILQRFPAFVKFHRSFILNSEHIESILGNSLKLSNGLEITVGDNYKKEFTVFLEGKILKAGRRL